jgi:ribokinase
VRSLTGRLAEKAWLTVAGDTPAIRATSRIVATSQIVEQNVLRVNKLRAVNAPTVSVVGSLNADLVVPVDHLPGSGETVLANAPGVLVLGGKGANQAAAAAAFGATVAMVGRVGDDDVGRQILADLAHRGIDIANVTVTTGARSGSATIALDPAGENLIIVDPAANSLLTDVDVSAAQIEKAAVVLVQLEVPLAAVSAALRAGAAAEGTRVVLNPAPARSLPAELTELVDVIVPNHAELARLSGAHEIAGLADIARIASALPGRAEVVVTLGKDGALVVPRSGPPVVIAAPLVDVVDTTGAGDCFCGTLAVSLAEGMNLTEAARWSVAAAAMSTTARGARGRIPTRDDVAPVARGLPEHVL